MSPEQLSVDVFLRLDHFDLRATFTATRHVTGIFGPSGAGKTNLLQSIAGLKGRATGRLALGGDVWLDSPRLVYVRPESRRIGYVPQEGLLFPHHNVRRNLLAGASRARRSGNPLEQTFQTVSELLEIAPLLDRDVATLSGGERQRVALGRAICSGPRLLLLDEPLASLDVPLRRRVLPFLRRVVDQFQIPMLLVSHDPMEVQALCDELIVLSKGEVVMKGEPPDVLTDPRVFPETLPAGFENILPCTVAESGEQRTEVSLRPGNPSLRLAVSGAHHTPGQRMWVGIPARDIILSSAHPLGLSAPNVLPGRVVSVRPVGDLRLITISVADGVRNLAAEVTPLACEELKLTQGNRVFVIINTASCVLYDSDFTSSALADRIGA